VRDFGAEMATSVKIAAALYGPVDGAPELGALLQKRAA
jgi:hypothetical protein